MQASRSGLHYHHETGAYLRSFALNVAYKSELLYFDEDNETTEKSMLDVKLKRRGKTRRVSKFCTNPSKLLPK